MREDAKQARMIEIEDVAYALIAERGYAGVSMLMIAKSAKASNETLYRWYGDKTGLVRSMIDRNAAFVTSELSGGEEDVDPLTELRRIAPRLLSMVLGDKAISLNKAAAGDASGELGQAIASRGRDVVGPKIGEIIARALDAGQLSAPSIQMACEWFIRLLLGDLQHRRVIGAIPELSPDDIHLRAEEACDTFLKLCAPKTH